MVVRFDEEDTMAAMGCSDGLIRVYNLNTANKLVELSTNAPHEKVATTALRWRPSAEGLAGSTLLAASGSGTLHQFLAKTGKKLWEKHEEDNYIFALDYNRKGTQFATAGKDCVVRVYDEETKQVAQKLHGVAWHKPGHNNRLFSLRFSPDDPNLLLSGGWDQNVHVWDLRKASVAATICGPKVCGDSLDIRGQHILTGAHRGSDQLQLWDLSSQQLLHTFQWDEAHRESGAFVFCCQFTKASGSGSDSVVAVGANVLKMFDLREDYRELLEARVGEQNTLYSLDTGNFSQKVVFGGKGGHTYYLNVNTHVE